MLGIIIEKPMGDKQHIGHGFQLSAVVDWYLHFFYLQRIRSANAVYIHLCIYSIYIYTLSLVGTNLLVLGLFPMVEILTVAT